MNHKLSAVIITFNEEKNIKRCIEGLLDIADEIIVVDSFSFDKTKSICQSFKEVTFVEHKWEGYSRQKNFANSQAQYDYIFSVDADEVPSEELKAAITKEKLHGFNGNYSMNRLTNYCGAWVKHGGWYPDRKIRIFPKNNTQWEGDFVHETLKTDASLPNKHLNGDLLHYSYHSVEEHIERIEKYSTLHAQQMKLDGKKPNDMKLLFGGAFKFFSTYILKLGFLDGKAGWNIAKYSAKAVSLKYQKLKQLHGSAS
jgi:glycosyltransferase involved in cell wall biosynthesis